MNAPRASRPLLFGLVLSMAAGTLPAVLAGAEQATGLYLGVDKSRVLELVEPARKVAVTNPNIADVQVINPGQLLINGKAVGVTSLVVFSARSQQHFNLVVHPAPVDGASAPVVSNDPHTVLVQRGDKTTKQFFLRDKDQHWLELGQVKPETDTGKK